MYKCDTSIDETDHSEGSDNTPSQGRCTADKPVRLLDSDPIVFHALPSTVSADGRCDIVV